MTLTMIIIAIIIASVLLYLLSLEGKYEVRRSLCMNVDKEAVFRKLCDFKSWAEWSPWLIHEPETELVFSDKPEQEGGWYTWNGKRIGEGKITHVKLEAPHRIEQRLEFVRPFKTVCSVSWELEDKEEQTEVTWTMQGEMPFFIRFMTNTTKQMIAKDYDLGLAMLRGKLDPNADKPVLDFEGEVALEPQRALTIPFKGGVKEMVAAMTEGFPKLTKHIEQSGKTPGGRPFVAYHKVNPQTMYFECDMAVPVDGETPQGEFQQKTLGGGKYFKVTLQGSYDFLEAAWYSAMSHIRMQKMKYDKSRPSLEIYENDCESVEHSNEIITGLYIPIR